MKPFLRDIAYACRTLRRAPGLVATAVLSLGLGIAATTAVFSFVNALQFKALPYASPDTLVDIEETSATELCAGCSVGTSYPTFRDAWPLTRPHQAPAVTDRKSRLRR